MFFNEFNSRIFFTILCFVRVARTPTICHHRVHIQVCVCICNCVPLLQGLSSLFLDRDQYDAHTDVSRTDILIIPSENPANTFHVSHIFVQEIFVKNNTVDRFLSFSFYVLININFMQIS